MFIILSIITMLYIRPPELPHLLMESSYSKTSFLLRYPSTLGNTILLCFYEFVFLYLSSNILFLSTYMYWHLYWLFPMPGTLFPRKQANDHFFTSFKSLLQFHFLVQTYADPLFKTAAYTAISVLLIFLALLVFFSILHISYLHTMQVTYLLCLLSVSLPVNCELHKSGDLFLSHSHLPPWH